MDSSSGLFTCCSGAALQLVVADQLSHLREGFFLGGPAMPDLRFRSSKPGRWRGVFLAEILSPCRRQ